jgi:N-acetyl-gamma-glutamyl-phosphate reductase
VFDHQHLDEIKQTLSFFQQQPFDLHFVPIRGDFSRGIFASISLEINKELETIINHYENYYQSSPFVHVQENPVHLKQVVNTNHCAISILKKGSMLHITSVIDNLLKGASGQAVQNMNRMFNLPETTGLNLKASAF